MNAEAPLAGVRVLDLGRLFAAPWCGQLLGDLGADVVKVERPGRGDEMRHYGPPWLDSGAGEPSLESSYYLSANRNKRSIAIDFTTMEGRDLMRRLASDCDVMIENFKVGDLERHGLDYPSIRAINPGIVYCSITGFGQSGPYSKRPAVDAVFQAMSGLMSLTGDPEGEPHKVGLVVVDLVTGLYAAVAILAALRQRETTGGAGQYVDMALLDSAMALLSHRAMEYLVTGDLPRRIGNGSVGTAPSGVFTCAGGSALQIQAGADAQFERLCRAIQRPDLFADPRFRERDERSRNQKVLMPILREHIAKRPRAEWMERLAGENVFFAAVNTIAEAFDDPQVRHRQIAQSTEHPVYGECPFVANPIRFSDAPAAVYRAPPMLGEHTRAILDELGLTAAEQERLVASGIVEAR